MKNVRINLNTILLYLGVALSFNAHALNASNSELIGTVGNAKIYVDSANVFSDKNFVLLTTYFMFDSPTIISDPTDPKISSARVSMVINCKKVEYVHFDTIFFNEKNEYIDSTRSLNWMKINKDSPWNRLYKSYCK
jgi:hypothetical protein